MCCPQCTSPAEGDEPVARASPEDVKQEHEDQEAEEVHPPATSTMTTATSPPPPQETEGQRHDDALPVEEPESTELGSRLVCAICDGVVDSDTALATHIQELGLNHLSSAEDVDGFACRVCRRVFASADVLDR